MNQEERDCLIKYSREPDNLPLVLAVGAIQEGLRIAIMTEFLEELREYVKAGLQRENLPWCVTARLHHLQRRENNISILSITREGSNWEIVLRKWQERKIYPCVKCDDESALTREQLKHALVGVGTGGGYDSYGCKAWRNIEPPYDDLGCDEALKTMNVKEERKEFVEHYGDEVLLKAVEGIENLL